MFHVEGDDLTKAGDLFFEIAHGGGEQFLQEGGVQQAERVTEPVATGKRALDIEAVVGVEVKGDLEAQFDDEQGMGEQKVAKVLGVDESFSDTQKEGFEVGGNGMAMRARAGGLPSLPALDDRPVEQGKEGTIALNKRIDVKQGGQGGLVKAMRSRYHNKRLLRVDWMCFF